MNVHSHIWYIIILKGVIMYDGQNYSKVIMVQMKDIHIHNTHTHTHSHTHTHTHTLTHTHTYTHVYTHTHAHTYTLLRHPPTVPYEQSQGCCDRP